MELRINDYVRTKNGRIFRWSSLCTTDIEDYMEHTRKILFIEDEIKSSPNIIDLIQVGDYVNGNKIIKISKDHCGRTILIYGYDDGNRQVAITIYEDEIKSIMTREMFESMEYKIGE